jgi:threonine aldolase
MAEQDWRTIFARCERVLGTKTAVPAAHVLRELAEALPQDALPDRYGEGEVVESFERRVAELLGKEAAVLMPTGTLAQQIALRLHCERRGPATVAFHPTCHLELHEHQAYAHLHGLRAELVGHRDALIALPDLERVRAPLGALLLELPQREIGGRLPEWDDLVAQTEWARSRGIALHLDGARLWECGPYYERSYAEIAGLFDTVYVSLYKLLGGPGGCVLAGPADLVAEARVWQVRHGGRLWQLFPLAAGGIEGLDRVLPRVPELLGHARAVAAAVAEVPGIAVAPDPPQTPLFHVHLEGEAETLDRRALELAAERRVWLFRRTAPTALPGVQRVELTIGVPALHVAAAEAAELFGALVGA